MGGALLAVAAGGAFLGLHYSNTGTRLPNHFRPGPVQTAPAPLKAAKLSGADTESVRQISARFIDTAVLRRRVDDSWDITTPKLRQGLTRKQWDLGNIPVTPFQPADAVAEIKYDIEWSGVNLVYVKIAIVPKPTSNVNGQAFDIGLRRKGDPAAHRWLVDYWVPSGIGVSTGGPAAKAAAGQSVAQPSSRIPVAYIFVPVGLLVALIVGLPVGIFGRQWLRGRRAVREYERERA
jgi:hypothetical protein